MVSNLEAALEYAELGFRVFPCQPNGKAPATEHGCLDATTDEKQIEAWWTKDPSLNVAIATEGLLVLDIDPQGKSWLETIEQRDLLHGPITLTPRKGSHYWFRQNGVELHNTAGKISEGVDTRANGGYVLVPPSVVNGKPYRWVEDLDDTLPLPPDWLLKLLDVPSKPIRESIEEKVIEGSRNNALFRFGAYFRRAGMTHQEIREALTPINQRRCKPPLDIDELELIAKSASRFDPDFIEESILMCHFDSGDDEHQPEIDARFPMEVIEGMPEIMQEAYDWIIESAVKPQPQLTLGGLISLFGAAFGRKVADDYDTRTNVMVLGIAPSGAGKEHPRQCNKRLLIEAGMELVNGPERIGSHAGIVSSVSQHPIRLFQIDEIGRLLETMRDPKASHLYNIGTVLMALYSSSNTIWTGDAYADLSKVKVINQPHVCVYGSSVPDKVYKALSPDNLTDGLVGRLLFLEAMDLPTRRRPKKNDPPPNVIAKLKQWYELTPPGWGDLGNGKPLVVEKTPEATERHESYCNQIHEKHRREDNVATAVWARAPEKAAKLALIYACCSAESTKPVISLAAENWGIKLANYSTRLILKSAAESVAGSKYEKNLKFVFNAIEDGISQWGLTRKIQRLTPRERSEILNDLMSRGAVETATVTTKGRQKTVWKKNKKSL
jgi:hypothetical protein